MPVLHTSTVVKTVGGIVKTVGGIVKTVGGIVKTVGGIVKTIGGIVKTIGGIVKTVGGIVKTVLLSKGGRKCLDVSYQACTSAIFIFQKMVLFVFRNIISVQTIKGLVKFYQNVSKNLKFHRTTT